MFSKWVKSNTNSIPIPRKKAQDLIDGSPVPSSPNKITWNTDRIEPKTPNSTQYITEDPTLKKSVSRGDDNRVRLTMKSTGAWDKMVGIKDAPDIPRSTERSKAIAKNIVDASDILAVLHPKYSGTGGVIFPYTPVINYSYMAEWTPMPLVHTNYQNESFSRSYPSDITITGLFTAQTYEEARYSLAVIHFFRTVTKMFYGTSEGDLAGTPPPTLLLSGHGEMMFNKIPVVVKSFLHDLTNDADYVEINTKNGSAWVPTAFTISITLGIQQNLIKVRDEFSMQKFASGKLLGGKGGYL